ncbi:hypothetical protein ABZ805_18155 [Saccharopolyspora sp. NPDC047091]|uniref:hypothetical protein n=1 Tax=Saccharopolyspora sp. NPDC047091 TaxID=3155924 RepID=UPI0033F6C438
MLTSIGLIATAFGMAVASALLPVISVEIFVIGLVVKSPEVPWWLLALVVTIGQIGGKLLYFYAARGVIRLPRFLQRKSEPGEHRGRWAAWLERFRVGCQTRPMWTGGVLLLSAVASLPPFLATCVAAGWARVPLSTFLVTGLVGRFVRFAALAVAPGAMIAWL